MPATPMRSLGLRAFLPVLALLPLVACAVGPGDSADSNEDALTGSAKVSPTHLMSDEQLEGGQHLTAATLQAFLTAKRSALAAYKDPGTGESAASMIVSRSTAQRINPIYLLARIQGESSLVQSGNTKGIEKATGCACPDGQACAKSSGGFAKQIECTSSLMRKYLDQLDTKGATQSGWKVGVAKSTLDPCTVKPDNRATAAIYTYTPWVGGY